MRALPVIVDDIAIDSADTPSTARLFAALVLEPLGYEVTGVSVQDWTDPDDDAAVPVPVPAFIVAFKGVNNG